jgi:hypothetical protein
MKISLRKNLFAAMFLLLGIFGAAEAQSYAETN